MCIPLKMFQDRQILIGAFIAVIFKSPLQLYLKVSISLTFSTFVLAHVVIDAGPIDFLVDN